MIDIKGTVSRHSSLNFYKPPFCLYMQIDVYPGIFRIVREIVFLFPIC